MVTARCPQRYLERNFELRRFPVVGWSAAERIVALLEKVHNLLDPRPTYGRG